MYIQPSPMVDEFSRGYFGRLLRLNGWPNATIGMRCLRSKFREHCGHTQRVFAIEAVAKASGLTLPEFVLHHTMIPLQRAVTSRVARVSHGSMGQVPFIHHWGMREPREGAFFCHRCINSDYAQNGMPYWRRIHQIPGTYWCHIHRSALSIVPQPNAFALSPASWIHDHHIISERWVKRLRDNETIFRFSSLAKYFLSSAQPLDETIVASVARSRAIEMGLQAKKGRSNNEILSFSSRQKLDKAWLRSVLPSFRVHANNHLYHLLCRIVMAHNSIAPIGYILAFAVLYDKSDEAIRAMSTTKEDAQ